MVNENKPKRVAAVIKFDLPDIDDGELLEALYVSMLNRIDAVITKNGYDRNLRGMVNSYITVPQYYMNNGMEDRFINDSIETLDAMITDLEDLPEFHSTLLEVAKCGKNNWKLTQVTKNRIHLLLW